MARPVGTPSHDKMQVLSFIRDFIANNGYSPSLREIVDGTEVDSTSTASTYLQTLEDDGYIKRVRGIARGITLVKR